jgi:hypothetical protein
MPRVRRHVVVENSSHEVVKKENWELGRVLEMADKGDWEEIARKELDCDKKTSRVIWSYNETVVNLLPGYG